MSNFPTLVYLRIWFKERDSQFKLRRIEFVPDKETPAFYLIDKLRINDNVSLHYLESKIKKAEINKIQNTDLFGRESFEREVYCKKENESEIFDRLFKELEVAIIKQYNFINEVKTAWYKFV